MTVDIKALARLGAVERLAAIARERADLEKAFPDLRVAAHAHVARVPAPKLHWTQQPKNRARMLRQMRKASKARHQSQS